MSSYSIRWTKRAEKQLARLDANLRQRILAAVETLGENPRPQGAKKVKTQKGTWRIRVGDWRILYTIDDAARLVVIVGVKPRGGAY